MSQPLEAWRLGLEAWGLGLFFIIPDPLLLEAI